MIELDQVDPAVFAGLRGLFFDIDETLSTRGKLTAEAYSALWDLHDAGLKLAPVTGRPAGWCDHIARFWPVDAVVGENGGFYFHDDERKLHHRFIHKEDERAEFRRRLDSIRERILGEVPGCSVASDQPYRECDLAIDYCEDVEPLGPEAVQKIKTIFEDEGAHAKVSSIHVNGWFGDFDKLTTAKLCARELWDVDLENENEKFAFVGDSPNDEPMFAFFKVSVGVANVRPMLGMMNRGPAYITRLESGAGFRELADAILSSRR